jgi:hypothetical protein
MAQTYIQDPSARLDYTFDWTASSSTRRGGRAHDAPTRGPPRRSPSLRA